MRDLIIRKLRSFGKKERELKRILKYPRFTEGTTNLFGSPFTFHDSLSFIITYTEIFQNEIYKFNPSNGRDTILDCGANMGLSVTYFSKNYPAHSIIAFEPDERLFNIVQKNINSLGLQNVQVVKKAVWDKEEQLSFFTDGGMGGRVNKIYADQKAVTIATVPLKDYLSSKVDFLKIDIEGAEDVVLTSCKNELSQVQYIFFEYHSNIKSDQSLDKLLKLVKDAGFRYYVKESATRKRPFVDTDVICEIFDMAINIFCYKP